jgi:hypothetical protein
MTGGELEELAVAVARELARTLPDVFEDDEGDDICSRSEKVAVSALAARAAPLLARRSREAIHSIFAGYEITDAEGVAQIASAAELEGFGGEGGLDALASMMGEEEWVAYLSNPVAAYTPGSVIVEILHAPVLD